MKKNILNGFGLIEILIVIAVIGILAGIVVTSFSTLGTITQVNARDAKRKVEISTVGNFLKISCYMPNGGAGEYDLMPLSKEMIAKNPQYGASH